MTDPREMLARLNPTNVRFDVGRGGGNPELTNIDIAGALGMVPAGLGRNLLEYNAKHPDDRSKRDRVAIGDLLKAVAQAEWGRRAEAHIHARVVAGLAAVVWEEGESRFDRDRRVGALQAKIPIARENMWPDGVGQKVEAMLDSLLAEFCGSPRKTNEEMGVMLGLKSESGYRKVWAPIYQHLLDVMRDEEQEAARRLKRALSSRAA